MKRRIEEGQSIQPLTLFGMVGILTIIPFRVVEIQLNWKTQENNLLLHFFSFNDLNKIDVEAATSLKERMCKSALDSIKETFQTVD